MDNDITQTNQHLVAHSTPRPADEYMAAWKTQIAAERAKFTSEDIPSDIRFIDGDLFIRLTPEALKGLFPIETVKHFSTTPTFGDLVKEAEAKTQSGGTEPTS